jgi:pimeloyl-ACP methyl ester carboxylesterase
MTRRLLFLPGAGADPEFWKPLGNLLPAQWQKTYLGWPGIGNQPPHPDVNGFDDLVALVEANLGDSPVDLLAQSMGGAIALRVALNHPNRIRRLVLAATSGGIDVTKLGAADWRPAYQAAFPNSATWITQTRPDFTSEASQIKQPTLLLWGDTDPISPLAVGETLLRMLPSASLHVVRGGDHGFVNDRAPEIANVVQRHLECSR